MHDILWWIYVVVMLESSSHNRIKLVSDGGLRLVAIKLVAWDLLVCYYLLIVLYKNITKLAAILLNWGYKLAFKLIWLIFKE